MCESGGRGASRRGGAGPEHLCGRARARALRGIVVRPLLLQGGARRADPREGGRWHDLRSEAPRALRPLPRDETVDLVRQHECVPGVPKRPLRRPSPAPPLAERRWHWDCRRHLGRDALDPVGVESQRHEVHTLGASVRLCSRSAQARSRQARICQSSRRRPPKPGGAMAS